MHFENEIEHKILVTYVIAKVSECFYNAGELTVDELMKQIDDYMDYYNRERCRAESCRIQNPACTERLKRLL